MKNESIRHKKHRNPDVRPENVIAEIATKILGEKITYPKVPAGALAMIAKKSTGEYTTRK